MAKGDDGNYLQHCVELAAACRLGAENPDALHVAFAHGMAPFESFERGLSDKAPGLSRCRLKAALGLAGKPWQEGEPAIVTAYRCVGASRRYPNSAEILRTLRRELAGGIAETCPVKHKQLAAAWAGSPVQTAMASWRCEVRPGGVLACPPDLHVPWLFTMDPMTYRQTGQYRDDDNLHWKDIAQLRGPLCRYVDSKQPGMVALFAYGMQEKRCCAFWGFVEELSSLTDMRYQKHQITHNGGNKNLAALLFSSLDEADGFLQDAVEEIEDFALAAAMENGEEGYSNWESISRILRNHNEGISPEEL